jgi:hypothetical protein
VTPHGDRGELNVYAADPAARRDRAFRPVQLTGVMVFAEKAADSTWSEMPSQRYYSGAEEVEARVEAGHRFLASGRPELLFSIRPKPLGRLRVAKHILLAENRTVEDFKMVAAGGQKVRVLVSVLLMIARAIRRLKEL